MKSMFSLVRKRISYANVAATLAVLFAMTGGALAASKYIITSTKQIKPSVLAQIKTQIKSKNGAPGKAGAQGPQGPAGPAGAPGASGGKGENGSNGSEGKAGKDGPTGPKGTNGTNGTTGATGPTGQTGFTEILPSGKTETGTWAMSVYLPEEFHEFYSPISFSIPLAKELELSKVHYLKQNATPTTECPGSAEEPKALKGNLCVYAKEEETEFLGTVAIFGMHAGSGASTSGALVRAETTENGGRIRIFGSWAVTAP